MTAVAKRALELGCAAVAWDLWTENARARAFYLSLGAEIDDTLQVLRIAPQRLAQ